MATESVKAQIEGGKASAAPPLGPALGPLGVNIGQVVAKINEKTQSFKGMQVPVTVTVDVDTKEFEISIGTPPTAALVKKEAGIQKGAGNPLKEKVADLRIEHVIKIAKMKEDAMLGADVKAKVLEVLGTCQSMGVKVEEVDAADAIKLVKEGKFDKEIASGKTELSEEELKEIEEEKKKLDEEMKKRRGEWEAQAKTIAKEMAGKTANAMRAKFIAAGIPEPIYKEHLPADEKKKK